MTTNYNDDEDDDFTDSGQDAITQLRKVNKTLEKRAKELEQELNNLQKQNRQRTVKDVLEAKGVNPKIATFIPADIDTSEEGITAWLTEYGDVFGVESAGQEAKAPAQDLTAQHRITNVVSTGQAPDIDEDALAKILSAGSPAELNRILGIS